ncbi:isoprenylcysteine carboxyl methyltransferase [Myxococcus sp. AM009]|uniref:isoprenylcysteine carboxyl methyltransferase family protein n=1 Tax=unclassified Myxococcus TaxID=2648731 RepID=UPI001595FC20|nr:MULTISPECIES: isoprenylcysteine carboxylmethyltransferase family protein [unclassified Myxococcus]NVI97746.1 isoprenylcysteine carboxyl methyltransferase [Myxococcus sp. AM009]NVJ15825.1 isoprenylcysteine carboxyl methyltransferase [Myxococcus sp. AM010]
MVTQAGFTLLVVLVFLQRGLEQRFSDRNTAALRERGAKDHTPRALSRRMLVLHMAWFAAMLLEVWALDRPFQAPLGIAMATAVLLAQALRYASMQALGLQWTLGLLTLPELGVVDRGIYRCCRHPSVFAVMVEMFALPLVHGAYLTSAVFGCVYTALLVHRTDLEEQALKQDTDYARLLMDRPRYLPLPPTLRVGRGRHS